MTKSHAHLPQRPTHSSVETDHFSGHAVQYALHRPSYPDTLFEWLASTCNETGLVWDCGTGNGQAATKLARHFASVWATDLSTDQIANAELCQRVTYRASPAHQSGLATNSADLLTVAQALHWFCNDSFYTEARRVLKPGAVLAAWTYRLLDSEPAINEEIVDFHDHVVGPWWPAERRWVDVGYQHMPFPFKEIAAPQFTIELNWTLDQLLAYLRTWSATQRCIQETGTDPTKPLAARLKGRWGNPASPKLIRWPITMRCGRNE